MATILLSTGQRVPVAKSEDSPLEILKKSNARAEIDKEEFEQKKKDLME